MEKKRRNFVDTDRHKLGIYSKLSDVESEQNPKEINLNAIESTILFLLKEDFLILFKQNLNKLYPKIDKNYLNINFGTLGWGNAFKDTCNTLHQMELLNYYESLDWEESDYFSYKLGQLMIERGFTE